MIALSPIGIFRCSARFKFDVPRQGVLNAADEKRIGRIELNAGLNFEQALDGLQGFRRIWLIYRMHRNESWKPKVSPQNADVKIGVFATRAPYRPNFLGMSCVKLEEIRGRELFVSEYDLLDETPILDIKPYLPYSDAFTEEESLHPECWWTPARVYRVNWAGRALERAEWIEERAGVELRRAVSAQLELQPLDRRRKRLTALGDDRWRLAYRTWRLDFSIDEAGGQIQVEDVKSAYEQQGFDRIGGVPPGAENALELHLNFMNVF